MPLKARATELSQPMRMFASLPPDWLLCVVVLTAVCEPLVL